MGLRHLGLMHVLNCYTTTTYHITTTHNAIIDIIYQSVSQSDVYYSLYDIIANKIHIQHYCGMQHYGSIYGYAQSTFSQINLATR